MATEIWLAHLASTVCGKWLWTRCRMLTKSYFSNWMTLTMVEEDVTKTCLKRDLDLMWENLHLVTELLMTGISYRHSVLIAVQWILSENICQLNWNRKLVIYVSCVSFQTVGTIWHLKPMLTHASCVILTLVVLVKSMKLWMLQGICCCACFTSGSEVFVRLASRWNSLMMMMMMMFVEQRVIYKIYKIA